MKIWQREVSEKKFSGWARTLAGYSRSFFWIEKCYDVADEHNA